MAAILDIVMASSTTTIQVRRDTAERLKAIKIPGLTYDDVINLALDSLPPEEIEELFEEWQKESFAALKKNPRVRKAEDVEGSS